MMKRLIRWAREGSIATITVVTLASAPLAAQASWFSDVKDAAVGIGALLNPTHGNDIGKFALGTIMMGGGAAVWASSGMAIGAAAIVGTALTVTGVGLIVVGAGLAIYGGYKIWKSFQDDGTPKPTTPTRPGAGGSEPGSPGRIDPDRSGTGAGTPGAPGSGTTIEGGGNTAPGNNSGRRPLPLPGRRVPITAPSTTPSAPGAGMPR